MKSIVLCVFMLSCASFLEAGLGQFRCDYTYFAEGKGWYKLHGESETWRDAKKMCSIEDTVLVEPTSKGMEDALLLLMQDTRVTEVRTDIQWQDDKSANHKSLTKNGTYRNVGDEDYMPFACYRQLGETVQLNECGNLDPAYRLDNRTGNCYKYHSEIMYWFNARETCSMEEGQLAIINSEDEAQVIRDIFLEHPRNPQEGKDEAFVGISTLGGGWHTVERQTLTEAGYNVWSAGEPNSAKYDDDVLLCGSISRDGEFVDYICTHTLLPFICEKKPDCSVADSEPFILSKNDVGEYKIGNKRNNRYVVLKP